MDGRKTTLYVGKALLKSNLADKRYGDGELPSGKLTVPFLCPIALVPLSEKLVWQGKARSV